MMNMTATNIHLQKRMKLTVTPSNKIQKKRQTTQTKLENY